MDADGRELDVTPGIQSACPRQAIDLLEGRQSPAQYGGSRLRYSAVDFKFSIHYRDSMTNAYVHGYDPRENLRLQDQASTLVELLHADTAYPEGSSVLKAGCGVGAQTITLASNSPKALITSMDVSEASEAARL